jgi:hypothetical protein
LVPEGWQGGAHGAATSAGAGDAVGSVLADVGLSDLVGYLIIAAPDVAALGEIAPAIIALVDAGLVRVLDAVIIERGADDSVGVIDLEQPSTNPAAHPPPLVPRAVPGMLSDTDIELVSFAIRPGSAGIVLVTEDRWAEPVAAATERAGGRIVAGERIPLSRVHAVLADARPEGSEARDDA